MIFYIFTNTAVLIAVLIDNICIFNSVIAKAYTISPARERPALAQELGEGDESGCSSFACFSFSFWYPIPMAPFSFLGLRHHKNSDFLVVVEKEKVEVPELSRI